MSTSPVLSPALSAADTSLTAAQANILADSQAMVASLNAKLIALYHSAYVDYVANMQSGENVPANRRTPPAPPMAWELAPADANGFVFYQIGTTPVCAAGAQVTCNFDNPAPSAKPAGVIDVGHLISGKWFSVGQADTFPVGMTTPPTTSEDGTSGTFAKYGAPVGPGWYLQVG
jgi:hypothetical protein